MYQLIKNIAEEILGQSEALWVSPDGSKLAYITFNDSMVELITLRDYGTIKNSGAPIREVNLKEKAFRYPKVKKRCKKHPFRGIRNLT